MRIRWPFVLLGVLISALLAFIFTIHFLGSKTNFITRYPGDARNVIVRDAAAHCNASDPVRLRYGECSLLIECILSNLNDIYKNDLATGTTILGLLPSIMGIAAAQPEEIVKLALVSPFRGVAIAAFSVGISPSIFTRLKPIGSVPQEAVVRTWIIPLARVTQQWSWRHVIVKVFADVFILTLTGVMLWQNWTVNSAVLVQWLCESPLMIFTWPLISMVWVVAAVSLLYAMAEKISFKHATEDVEYGWWQVFLIPYTLDVDCLYHWDLGLPRLFPPHSNASKWIRGVSFRLNRTALSPGTQINMTNPAVFSPQTQNIDKYAIRIVVKMPNNSMLANWKAYFFVIEVCAIAIYFYATFVLLSALFIGSVGSVKFSSIMAGIYTGVRLVECQF